MRGQWFLVGAVVASAALLFISTLATEFFVVDLSLFPRMDEPYVFENVVRALNKTVVNYVLLSAKERALRIREYIEFVSEKLAGRGYYLEIVNETSLESIPVRFKITLLSEHANITRTVVLP
mgnify:CR=1 FL=1